MVRTCMYICEKFINKSLVSGAIAESHDTVDIN